MNKYLIYTLRILASIIPAWLIFGLIAGIVKFLFRATLENAFFNMSLTIILVILFALPLKNKMSDMIKLVIMVSMNIIVFLAFITSIFS